MRASGRIEIADRGERAVMTAFLVMLWVARLVALHALVAPPSLAVAAFLALTYLTLALLTERNLHRAVPGMEPIIGWVGRPILFVIRLPALARRMLWAAREGGR